MYVMDSWQSQPPKLGPRDTMVSHPVVTFGNMLKIWDGERYWVSVDTCQSMKHTEEQIS